MPKPRSTRRKPPAFIPVQLRTRRDGWTHQRQCEFLAALYLKGSVAAAARAVGMSRMSAYRLRAKEGAESFAAAWDFVMSGPVDPAQPWRRKRVKVADWRKVTLSDLSWRIEAGYWQPVIYRGRLTAIAQKPDNSALLRLISRLNTRTRGLEEVSM